MAITILLRTYYNLRLLFLYVNRNTYIRKSIEMDFVKKYRIYVLQHVYVQDSAKSTLILHVFLVLLEHSHFQLHMQVFLHSLGKRQTHFRHTLHIFLRY